MTLPTEFANNQLLVYGMNKVCAICHMKLETEQTHYLFRKIIPDMEQIISAFQALESFSKFSIANGPQNLCTTCFHKTIATYKFIVMCNRAQENLENYFKQRSDIDEIQILKANMEISMRQGDIEMQNLLKDEVNISETEVTEVIGANRDYEDILLEDDDIKTEIEVFNDNECEEASSDFDIDISQEPQDRPKRMREKPLICYNVSSDSDGEGEDEVFLPPEVKLPERSRERYEIVYQKFMDWRRSKTNFAELISQSVMLSYFEGLAQTLKPNSLWVTYCMLRATISQKHDNINIATYSNLIILLKRKSQGFKSKKLKCLCSKQLNEFLQNAPDEEFLFVKMVLIFELSGGCKRQEMQNIRLEHVEDTGKSLIINIPGSTSKSRLRPQRYFIVPEIYYPTCKKYISLRPPGEDSKYLPFFLYYSNGKCTKFRAGINKFGSIGKRVAEFLELPDAKEYAVLVKSKHVEIEIGEQTSVKKNTGMDAEDEQSKSSDNQERTDIGESFDETSTPAEINENASTINLLPEKSRERYEVVYHRFMDWKLKNNAESITESVMLTYFEELAVKMKPSSLWAIYSMLRATINVKHDNTNIAKYSKLLALLKNKANGFKSKKSQTLSVQNINDFLQNAPDRKYLFMKVVLIFGVSGACRKQELRNVKPEHVEDTGKSLIITIPDTLSRPSRYFVVSESNYPTCKKYINLRPQLTASTKDLPFFVHYINGKCTKQCVGINTFGSISKQIAEYLGLPDPKQYTGHCFRRSAAIIGDQIAAIK